jgi:hypothetical protein
MKALLLCAGAMLLGGCAVAPPRGAPVDPVPLKLQAYQAQAFDASKEAVFNATVSVLQDMGCSIDSAEIRTGYISAQTPIVLRGKWVKSMNSAKVTAFVVQTRENKSRVRLTFVGRNTARGKTEEQLNENPGLYEQMFVRVREAVFAQKN